MEKISRKEALNQGLKTYFIGKPCKYGHVCERFVSNYTCIECSKNISNKYYKNNREHKNQYFSKYFKQYYQNNKDFLKQYNNVWKKNNPEKVILLRERRCKALKEYTPLWYEPDLVKQLYSKRDELNQKWNLNLEVDHIIPILSKTVCGLHCWNNLQLLNAELNNSKQNSYEKNW